MLLGRTGKSALLHDFMSAYITDMRARKFQLLGNRCHPSPGAAWKGALRCLSDWINCVQPCNSSQAQCCCVEQIWWFQAGEAGVASFGRASCHVQCRQGAFCDEQQQASCSHVAGASVTPHAAAAADMVVQQDQHICNWSEVMVWPAGGCDAHWGVCHGVPAAWRPFLGLQGSPVLQKEDFASIVPGAPSCARSRRLCDWAADAGCGSCP